jgi:hypothetical protein
LDSHPPTSPGFTLPLAVTYRDDSGPFAIEATVTDWRSYFAADEGAAIRLTIGTGTLHDADKGAFPLDGLELFMRVVSHGFEPLAVLNPGVLSEFQQEGLLDAISSYLNSVAPPTRASGDRP